MLIRTIKVSTRNLRVAIIASAMLIVGSLRTQRFLCGLCGCLFTVEFAEESAELAEADAGVYDPVSLLPERLINS
jgi:hypothetical protein